ncbi:MAG TPA: CBS domain-containing protein [Candidatus Polarisedimenticolaceae bacterium]|nr:CBS domain-containing protein [Candidatus Polarisedimenticolaceae bacterium]
MGDRIVKTESESAERREFMRHLLDDLRALERMLAAGTIESGVRRIGAEQEMFLVDGACRPAPVSLQLLERLDDPHFTIELGLFNLEVNLEPRLFGADCLAEMERELSGRLEQIVRAGEPLGVRPLLTGILPTLRKSDLGLDNMTPVPRFRAINRAMTELRGGAYELYIRGADELLLRHESVMLEACNASFQVHLQVGPSEFPRLYNLAQVIAAPVVAVGANSPLLFGRQLWRETRIALFQQAVDTRRSTEFLRERSPRVTFGNGWVRRSVAELFQEDVARFRLLVTRPIEEDPLAVLDRGEVPELSALRLHTSTVWRWNRACYGMTGGRPHLRIENRVLPAGPSIQDEVANAAFWLGLMVGLEARYDDVTRAISFEDAKMNFTAAAREGLGAQLLWLDGSRLPVVPLVCDRLLPIARDGLRAQGVNEQDAERYLGRIDTGVRKMRNGAEWQVQSLAELRGRGSPALCLGALTGAMLERQRANLPVAAWEPARVEEGGSRQHSFSRVEQYMTTDLFTVGEDESLDLIACLMEWERIRHVPVEDAQHRLVGLVSYRALLRLMAQGVAPRQLAVSAIMKRDPITISPDATTLEAIERMRRHRIGCLPVVQDERLVGIVTERDLMDLAAELLEQRNGNGP